MEKNVSSSAAAYQGKADHLAQNSIVATLPPETFHKASGYLNKASGYLYKNTSRLPTAMLVLHGFELISNGSSLKICGFLKARGLFGNCDDFDSG
jgi:hypothetical protein